MKALKTLVLPPVRPRMRVPKTLMLPPVHPRMRVLTTLVLPPGHILFYSGTRTLSDINKGKEVPSKPDFVLHINKGPLNWTGVELVFEHTWGSGETVTAKFLQWLRKAWSVFHHQPFHRYLYRIILKK